MKFGRYLSENATPEWKRAYIDYRACKKAIKRVAKRLQSHPDGEHHEHGDGGDKDGNNSSSGDDDDNGPAIHRTVSMVRSPNVGATAGGTTPPGLTSPKPSIPATPAAPVAPPPTLAFPTPASQLASPRTRPGTERNAHSPRPHTLSPHAHSPRSPRAKSPKPGSARSGPTPSILRPSPNYGAMGHSPVPTPGTAGTGTGSGGLGVPAIKAPPPLDLGEPSLDVDPEESGGGDGRAPGKGTKSAFRELERLNRRVNNGGPGQAGRVNFSPLVHSIPDDGDEADNEADGAGETTQDGEGDSGERSASSADGLNRSPPALDPASASPSTAGYATAPVSRTDSRSTRRSRGHASHGSGSGFSPRLALISGRVQPSAAVSTTGMQDAPSGRKSIRSLKLPSPRLQARSARSFDELYDSLEPDEKAFFDLLDHELEKVETFYSAREGEAENKMVQLREQLRELAEHRKVFHKEFPEGVPEWEATVARVIPRHDKVLSAVGRVKLRNPFTQSDGEESGASNGKIRANGRPASSVHESTTSVASQSQSGRGTPNLNGKAKQDELDRQYSPERYQKYKKDLRSAMLEYYHHLELIKNYRILNLTGFRKALKKFEKVTKIVCLELYTEDRIAPCSFSRGDTIDRLIKETEDLFTEHFEHGDSKRARDKLRNQNQTVTHYLTVFRSGIMLGLAVPTAVLALVKSFEPATRAAIPQYQALLQVYGALYTPVLFAMLFELNLLVWVEARINYEFVMEIERPKLDYRSYFEIPTFMFLTLSYCFFFSFYRVATHSVAPTTWPLAWVVFAVAFFINPLPLFRRRSRYWLLKVLWRVCTPGYSRVEFIAFFIADELNSLTFFIQNFMFMGCVYSHGWPANTYAVCPSGRSWPYALLACLAPLSRLIQCLKRYHDSKLHIHLINAGKYLSSIITACLFVHWRHEGSPHADVSFAIWIVFATINSFYTCSWDFVVDWSLLRPGYKLLRPDLGYSFRPFYYFAMVTNLLIRFIWVWYLPDIHDHLKLRGWVFAIMEMLRRWQWNFFRVETEHLGNADAYRVTREIPLPYRRLEGDSDDERPRVPHSHPLADHIRRMRERLVGDPGGRGPDALNVGARGHAGQREYEARRPGDYRGSRERNSSDSAV